MPSDTTDPILPQPQDRASSSPIEGRDDMAWNRTSRVAVIGLDCAEPSLVFERFADRLPHLTRLRQQGAWGRLRSCDPPITVPAWMAMMSSKDPGTLGYYGFRNRADPPETRESTGTPPGRPGP